MAATSQRGGGSTSAAIRRAMMPGEDAQTRFLRELAQRLPLDLVVEAHVFPPIRQGGAETGVAVIAARREVVAAAPASDGVELVGGELSTFGTDAATATSPAESPPGGAPPHGEVANSQRAEPHPSVAAGAKGSRAESSHAAGVDGEANGAASALAPTPHAPPATRPADRLTVFSARYRLALKGPDRGKWEVNVVEEADAPLVSVDAVVRGVQRRAGEGSEPERFTAEQLRALLGEPAPPPS